MEHSSAYFRDSQRLLAEEHGIHTVEKRINLGDAVSGSKHATAPEASTRGASETSPHLRKELTNLIPPGLLTHRVYAGPSLSLEENLFEPVKSSVDKARGVAASLHWESSLPYLT